MSIVTKKGDRGTTELFYRRRVSKCHPRVEACGAVDELNCALGMARAAAPNKRVAAQLLATQEELVNLMGELAVASRDLRRYAKDGFKRLGPGPASRLEAAIAVLESKQRPAKGWAMPGASIPSAALDMARAVCRRAERRVCALHDAGQLRNPEIIIYLNRLSDWLWLLARDATRAR